MREKAPKPLLNDRATSSPRTGEIGLLPVDEIEVSGSDEEQVVPMYVAVTCPNCGNYGRVNGDGVEFRNVTRLIDPVYSCTVCSWGPPSAAESPTQWRVWYSGRLGGTLLWAVNEIHITTLIRYIETPPPRRTEIEFDWEYRRLMQRLPLEMTSGRQRNDVVSLLKKLQRTRPRDV